MELYRFVVGNMVKGFSDVASNLEHFYMYFPDGRIEKFLSDAPQPVAEGAQTL